MQLPRRWKVAFGAAVSAGLLSGSVGVQGRVGVERRLATDKAKADEDKKGDADKKKPTAETFLKTEFDGEECGKVIKFFKDGKKVETAERGDNKLADKSTEDLKTGGWSEPAKDFKIEVSEWHTDVKIADESSLTIKGVVIAEKGLIIAADPKPEVPDKTAWNEAFQTTAAAEAYLKALKDGAELFVKYRDTNFQCKDAVLTEVKTTTTTTTTAAEKKGLCGYGYAIELGIPGALCCLCIIVAVMMNGNKDSGEAGEAGAGEEKSDGASDNDGDGIGKGDDEEEGDDDEDEEE